MGESYLQRKVFGRRLGAQSPAPNQQQTSIKQLEPPPPPPPPTTLCNDDSGDDSEQQQPPAPNATSEPKPHSKLRGAFRAIQFFRRAKERRPNLWPSPAGINNSNSAGRLTLASSASSAHSHSQESHSTSLGSGALPPERRPARANQSQAPAPQFIVPKMNALRLPLVCRIRSLEGELMREVFVHRYEEGKYLIESLKVSVGLQDDKYFGLKMARSSDDQEDLRNAWLTLADSVCKQLKGRQGAWPLRVAVTGAAKGHTRAVDFYLRIKFYPPNLGRVQDQFLRNYLWLQLRRDLRLGKLISSANNLCQLMACVCQWELGDYQPELVPRLSELNILPNQDLIEERAVEVWRTRLQGLQRHQAQMQFLRAAVILETYGFDYYQVRDHQRQRQYLLGFNYAGVKTIRNGRIVHHFTWHSMSKISLENRMIIFHIYPTENSKRKQVLGFKCLSQEDCKSLYMRLLEQKYFFTIELAYFDKSVRRPSCLYSSGGSSSANQLLAPNDAANVAWDGHQSSQELGDGTSNATRHTSCGPSLERDRSTDSSSAPNLASDCACRSNESANPSPATPTRSERPASESAGRSLVAGRLQRQQATLQYLGRGNGSEEADEEDELDDDGDDVRLPGGLDHQPEQSWKLEQCWRLSNWPWASYFQAIQPAARLCGTLVMMSLFLKWTDSMSNYLIDLLTQTGVAPTLSHN